MAQTAAAETVTTEWAEEFLERWLAAWNSGQPERLLELMTDDIVYDDSGARQTMRGHAQVREFLEFAWRAFPDLTVERVGGPLVASDGRGRRSGGAPTRRTPDRSIRPASRRPAGLSTSGTAPTSTSIATARSPACGLCSTWPTSSGRWACYRGRGAGEGAGAAAVAQKP